MSNLTKTQQLILEFFVSEFTKINNTKNNSNEVFTLKSIDDANNKKENMIESYRVKSRYVLNQLEAQFYEDMDKFNNEFGSRLTSIDGYYFNGMYKKRVSDVFEYADEFIHSNIKFDPDCCRAHVTIYNTNAPLSNKSETYNHANGYEFIDVCVIMSFNKVTNKVEVGGEEVVFYEPVKLVWEYDQDSLSDLVQKSQKFQQRLIGLANKSKQQL